jgi:glycosyltransferase involved in cell wall biosynthesis
VTNVLYICADGGIPVLGNKGASVHVRSLTAAMQKLGHRVTLVARRWDEGNPAPCLHRLEHLDGDPDEAADQLERLIRIERTDVVIERYSLPSRAGRVATRRCGVPLTLEVNAPLAVEAARYRGLDDPGAEAREHETFRTADRIQVVSSALLHYARSVAPEVPAAWIPNGADVDRLRAAPPAALASTAGRVVLGFAGSMKPWHGVEAFLEAFARVYRENPRAMLVLVGTGPQAARLIERANRSDLRGGVLFTGQVPHAQIPSLVSRFDVAVAPYLRVEDFYFQPLKVVEYLACGKPVIYSDQGDLRALVGSGGLGYAPGSIRQLADRLVQVLGDAELRNDLAVAAAERGAGLDWSVIAERVVRFAAGAPDSGPAGTLSKAIPATGRPWPVGARPAVTR